LIEQEHPSAKVNKLVISAIAFVALIALIALLVIPGSDQTEDISPTTSIAQDDDEGEWLTQADFVDAQIRELFDVDELHSVPEGFEVTSSVTSVALQDVTIPRGNRRLANLRELIPSDENGGFLHPRVSPDGLQIMLTRPGYRGIYVAPAAGGDPELVAELNAWGARWTDDGRIVVNDHDGTRRIFGTDGTLEELTRIAPEERLVFYDEDQIFTRPEPGAPAVPITPNNDRYINPIPSPDGTHVAYLGMESGLYVMRTDGTGQFPSISPNGQTVVFEVDGSIYEGTLQ